MSRQFDIFLSPSYLSGEEQKYMNQAINAGQVSSVGENIIGFEKDICDYSNVNTCSALSSGTAAIHLALIMLGVEAEDEVLFPVYFFCYRKPYPIPKSHSYSDRLRKRYLEHEPGIIGSSD